MSFQPSPRPWRTRYTHGPQSKFEIHSGDGPVAAIQSTPHEHASADAHLVCAAPRLYEALKELLLSAEDALINQGIGCECSRCEQAKKQAYRAIGFAEGKTTLKEGGPGSA